MRLAISEISSLGVYPSRKEVCCTSNDSAIVFPSAADVNLQLIFGEEIGGVYNVIVRGCNGREVAGAGANMVNISEDVDNDGSTEYFGQIQGLTGNLTDGCYYLEISIGNGKVVYTDNFNIKCNVCYCIEFANDCDSEDFGHYSTGFKNRIFFESFEPTGGSVTENFTPITDGFGINKFLYGSVTGSYTANAVMSDSMVQSMLFVNTFDSKKIINKEANCDWELTRFNASGGGGCKFAGSLSWDLKTRLKLDGCCDSAYENAPYVDCNDDPDPPLECEGFAVTLNVNGTLLTYSITNNPDPNLPIIVSWFLNGSYLGTASSVEKGGYGTYKVRVKIGNCTAEDEYICLDPCANFSVELVKNGLKIDGAVNGVPEGESETVVICDSDGNVVGNGFPTIVPEQGIYTVKVTTESCEFIQLCPLVDPLECDFDFELTKDENGTVSPIFNPQPTGTLSYLWYAYYSGTIKSFIGTSSSITPNQTGFYELTVTNNVNGEICSVTKGIMCIIDEDKLKVIICNDLTNPISVDVDIPPIEIPAIDVNVEIPPIEIPPIEIPPIEIPPIDVNLPDCLDVNIKNECLFVKECPECTTGDVTFNCEDCILTIQLTGYEGYTWELTDPNNNAVPFTFGEPLNLNAPPTGIGIEGTYTLTGTLQGCPQVVLTYEHEIPNAGEDTNQIININP